MSWVKHGLIMRWEGPAMDADPEECSAIDALTDLIRAAAHADWMERQVRVRQRFCCDACGCLLLPDEECPGCLVAAGVVREEAA